MGTGVALQREPRMELNLQQLKLQTYTPDTMTLDVKAEEFFINDMGLNDEEQITEISLQPIIDLKDILKAEIQANEIRALFENLEFEALSVCRL